MACDLVREEIKPTNETDDLFKELRDRSTKILGYNGLQEISNEEETKAILSKIFIKYQITPLEINSVRRYKQRKNNKEDRYAFTIMGVCYAAILATTLTLYFYGTVLLGGLVTIGVIGLIVSVFIGGGVFQYTSGRWIRTKIKEYGNPIPEFVLQTACDVSEELTKKNIKHQMCIDDFVLRRDMTIDDPLLVVVVGNVECYLEVWNEPDFKEKRTI